MRVASEDWPLHRRIQVLVYPAFGAWMEVVLNVLPFLKATVTI